MSDERERLKRIRRLLGFFVFGLVVSGLTAFPLVTEVGLLKAWFGAGTAVGRAWPGLAGWIERVYVGLVETERAFPFILYGTDWLAFAHLVIAVAFWGPYQDPVRNRWVIQFGMIACVAVIPLALLAGAVRGIPLFWRAIDCSFGVFGIIPLWLADREVVRWSAERGPPS
ncbi:MAG: cytoplasmic membrane protein [Elusimicrobia bacterium]|nr:MAG: cytoplasmic membrane protein [Elusimicrobiota bacterium]